MHKKLKGFSKYLVYDDGRIYGCYRKVFLKPDKVKKGHLRVCLTDDNSNKLHYFIHRLVAMVFISNPKNLPFVCHNDSNPENNNVDNLRWDNASGNMQDRLRLGRYANQVGENNYSAKLKEKEVVKIKKLLKYLSPYRIFKNKLFNISYGTLCDIQRGKSWKHITV